MELSSAESLLVVKPSSLGDVVQTLPAVNLLKERFPRLRIEWIVHTAWAPLLEGHPSLAGLIPFPREKFRGAAGAAAFCRWARRLGRLRPDLAVDFQGLLRSALMARLSGAERCVGMSDAREGARFLYDEAVPVRRDAHSIDRYLSVAAALGARVVEGDPALEYRLPDGAKPAGGGAENLPERFVLLHPYSRGEGKTLTAEQVRRFCEALSPHAVAIVGTRPAGRDTGPLPPGAIDLADRTTLLELLWLMRQAAFVVSVDSGPMHLAAAVAGNLLGIHTWTDPRRTGPHRADSWVWKAGAIRRVGGLAADDGSLDERRGEKISALTSGDIEQMAGFVAERLR